MMENNKPISNGDAIRKMTDKKLSIFLSDFVSIAKGDESDILTEEFLLKWLEEDVENEKASNSPS